MSSADLSRFTNNGNQTGNDVLSKLRPTEEVPLPYRSIFSKYLYFNVIQSAAYPHIFETSDNLVISAPTGSGKTVLFELAIVNLLLELKNESFAFKIVYIAPIKALCEERLQDWHLKFAQFGVSSLSVTGDSDEMDCEMGNLMLHNIIITTPEKWDSITRKWREHKDFVKLVRLFMIDEVHLLNDETRGATLEAIVSRMKIIQDCPDSGHNVRFMALSATIPNIEDISEWIGTAKKPATYFRFGEDMRPVKLKKIVLGYPYSPQLSSPFKFDIMLSYKLQNIILQHSDGKPTLIFCSTRKSTEMTAKQVTQQLTINLTLEQKNVLQEASNAITEGAIRETLIHGVGCHHAGIVYENRRILEDLFRKGHLPVLVTTSTLAMGINLPAHLVVVKSTKYYAKGEYRDHSESTILQMIGRAGRPQFDTSATAVIMTTSADVHKYQNMVGGSQPVESSLHKNLTEHLNAEVVLHTITDLSLAMQWLTSTFLYIRARKNPKHYGLPFGLSPKQTDQKLLELCQIEINKLGKEGLLILDEDISITPTSRAFLMAKYYLRFESFKLFSEINGQEIMQQVLALVSRCHEFSEMYLRVSDKKTLNLLNRCRDRETIRFPLNGKIKTVDMKINCLIQAVFGSLPITESALSVEAQRIIRIGERITKCLTEYLERKTNSFSALLSAIVLNKCFHTQLWENSPYITKQLPKIGVVYSKYLTDAGKKSFQDILQANPRDLERIVNKKPPFGNDLQEIVRRIPQYKIKLELQDENGSKFVNLYVKLLNAELLTSKMSVEENSYMNLIVGDDNNNVLLHEKYKHSYLRDNDDIIHAMEVKNSKIEEIRAYFISEDWVGLDSFDVLVLKPDASREFGKNFDYFETPNSTAAARAPTSTPSSKQKARKNKAAKQSSHIQKFMDTYFKKVKNINSATKAPKSAQKKTIQRTLTGLAKSAPKNNSAHVEVVKKSVDNFLSSVNKDMAKFEGLISKVVAETDVVKPLIATEITNAPISKKQKPAAKCTNLADTHADFEQKMLSPPKEANNSTLQEFARTGPKKLTSTALIPQNNQIISPNNQTVLPNNQTIPPGNQLIATSNESTSQKTLKWGSPLVSYINEANESSNSSISYSPVLPTKEPEQSSSGSKNVGSTAAASNARTKITRIASDDFKNNFKLTDADCQEGSRIVENDVDEFTDEIASSFLLEEIGFANAIKNITQNKDVAVNASKTLASSSKPVQKHFASTEDYYSKMQTQVKQRKISDGQDSNKDKNKDNEKEKDKETVKHIDKDKNSAPMELKTTDQEQLTADKCADSASGAKKAQICHSNLFALKPPSTALNLNLNFNTNTPHTHNPHNPHNNIIMQSRRFTNPSFSSLPDLEECFCRTKPKMFSASTPPQSPYENISVQLHVLSGNRRISLSPQPQNRELFCHDFAQKNKKHSFQNPEKLEAYASLNRFNLQPENQNFNNNRSANLMPQYSRKEKSAFYDEYPSCSNLSQSIFEDEDDLLDLTCDDLNKSIVANNVQENAYNNPYMFEDLNSRQSSLNERRTLPKEPPKFNYYSQFQPFSRNLSMASSLPYTTTTNNSHNSNYFNINNEDFAACNSRKNQFHFSPNYFSMTCPTNVQSVEHNFGSNGALLPDQTNQSLFCNNTRMSNLNLNLRGVGVEQPDKKFHSNTSFRFPKKSDDALFKRELIQRPPQIASIRNYGIFSNRQLAEIPYNHSNKPSNNSNYFSDSDMQNPFINNKQ